MSSCGQCVTGSDKAIPTLGGCSLAQSVMWAGVPRSSCAGPWTAGAPQPTIDWPFWHGASIETVEKGSRADVRWGGTSDAVPSHALLLALVLFRPLFRFVMQPPIATKASHQSLPKAAKGCNPRFLPSSPATSPAPCTPGSSRPRCLRPPPPTSAACSRWSPRSSAASAGGFGWGDVGGNAGEEE